jgi:hypothetical protein
MIGDAAARGKRKSTLAPGPEFKEKNHRGSSFKHIPGSPRKNSGGAHEQHATAKRMHAKGSRPGVGHPDRQAPHHQKARKETEHNEPGDLIDQWVQGKRGSYK